jgi:predicted ATP-dependent endonuclease of OLD family
MAKNAHTVILDEPDVYMHPDLQRRLIRFLRLNFKQVIITTHSVEIMSEVDPEEILVVDKRRPKSMFASSLKAVQIIIDKIGSAHNIHLARLWSSRCLILVEGDDLKILQKFQNILFPKSNHPFDSIPNMPIGGWGGWNYAIGSSMLLENAFGENIITHCILDSDYHAEDEIMERYKVAELHGVNLHIWSRKEIENYLLIPSAIQRLILKRKRKEIEAPTTDEIKEKIIELADGMEEEVLKGFTDEIHIRNRPRGAGAAGAMAIKIVRHEREDQNGIQNKVSGKSLIAKLSEWSKSEFGAQFNVLAIAKEIHPVEVPEEVKEVIDSIEECRPFRKI